MKNRENGWTNSELFWELLESTMTCMAIKKRPSLTSDRIIKELIEVTPEAIRMRKRHLNATTRKSLDTRGDPSPRRVPAGPAKAEGGTSSYNHGVLAAGYPWEIACARRTPGRSMPKVWLYGKD